MEVDIKDVESYLVDKHGFDIPRFCDINRAINYELHFGPLQHNYWSECEPLENYDWPGFENAICDIREMVDDLPMEIYYDHDSGVITESNPEDNEDNWSEHGEWIDTGYWEVINLPKLIMHTEVYRQVYG